MYQFTYTTHASRVVFGAGSMKLVQQEVEKLGARRALVLCTPEQRAQAEVVSSSSRFVECRSLRRGADARAH